MHAQGAACEWLMGLLFLVYVLLLLPEFHSFAVHVRLEPVVQQNHARQPLEYPPLLEH